MDKNKSFQDLLQDSLKELQESKELKGEQHEQSNKRMDEANKTTSIGQNENRENNRIARSNAQSERPRISTNPFLVVGRYGNLSITERESSRNRLSENRDREINRSNMESRESRAESERSQAMGEGTRSINTRSVSLKESNQDIQEIYSTQNRLSQTERREFSEILRETEIFKQQALHTYTDIQNITHILDTIDSKNNIETYQALESHTNTNESHNENKENKENKEHLQSQLTILKEHTHILTTTLSPKQKEQSHNKITKALENIENLTKNSNIDSAILENNTKLIQRATELISKYEKDKLRDNNKNKGRDR